MSSEAMTAPAEPPSESTLFAMSLKTYKEISFGPQNVTRTTVVNFDDKLFHKTCSISSNEYDENKCNYDEIMCELFKEGESWLSRDLVSHVVDLIAAKHGWTASKIQEKIICNRYGKGKSSTRNFSAGQLRADCALIIRLNALVKTPYFPESQKDTDQKKVRYKNVWDQPVEIKKGTCTVHSGGCNPGRQNRVATMSRKGSYVTDTPHSALYSLCNIAEHCGKLTSSAIKNVMKMVWPSQKTVTKQNIFYVRKKVMKCLPILRKSNDYEDFKSVVNCDDLLKGVDNEELDDDEAYQLAHTLWLEVLNTTDTKEEAIMSFIEYLELIKCRAKGFTYKLAEDTSGKEKKLVGVVWMTATMRRNFELFGGYISLDMMKRGINTLLWPYCAVVMYDEHKQICVACEGILCGEREDTYRFMARFLAENAPGRPLADVTIVAGDGFFDQDMIVDFGFINAQYIADLWHLLDSGLRNKFGKRAYELLGGHLTSMVKATSEEEFEKVLRLAYVLLEAQPQRDMQMEKDLDEFAACRHSYAVYLVATIPGNLNRHGSSISESNHSSTLVHLNDGNKQGNNFCEHPLVLIRELLGRQRKHSVEKNRKLHGDGQKMMSTLANLKEQPLTDDTQDLLTAVQRLNLPTYLRYQGYSERKHIFRVDHKHVVDKDSPQEFCTAVHSTLANEPPRVFPDELSRCYCPERLAEEDMCIHEILAKGGFDERFFKPRHFSRDSVSGSTTGWNDASTTTIDALIGYEPENIVGNEEGDGDGRESMFGVVEITDQNQNPLGDKNQNALGLAFASSDHVTLLRDQPPPAPKPGQLPSKSVGKVQPLHKKNMKNILTAVLDGYSNMREEDKFLVSDLVLQLQNVLTNQHDSTTISTKEQGISVVVPSNACIAMQPKKRLAPVHESYASSNKKMKLPSTSQSSVLVDTSHDELVCIPNSKSGQRCSFCRRFQHRVTSCERKQRFCMHANEYVLTTNDPSVSTSLRNRIEEMPVAEDCGKGSPPYASIAKEYLSHNFIIHEGRSFGTNGRIWCISFIGNDGEVIEDRTERSWVTSAAMNCLVTHQNKVKKYVFDETIIIKH